jgi:hypothetical protein
MRSYLPEARGLLSLMRFHFHASFVTVLVGISLAMMEGADWPGFKVLVLYVSFNVLLYGGLYTWNDVADRRADARDTRKCHRPVASGLIPPGVAGLWGLALIAGGLLCAHLLLSPVVFDVYLLFIAANLLYTLVLKPIPYAGLAVIGLTHTLRLALGILLAGMPPPFWLLVDVYLVMFCIAITIHGVFNAKPAERIYYPGGLRATLQGALLLGLALHAFLCPENGVGRWLPVAVLGVFVACAHLKGAKAMLARIFMTRHHSGIER